MVDVPAWVDGVLTPVEKLEAHVQGLRHKAVSVFVVAGNETLIQRRAMGKYHTPELWANTCCTHPDWGEDPHKCAKRRLQEELGITGLNPVHRDRIEYRADVGHGLIEHEVVDLYLAPAPRNLKIEPNPDEVMETRWIDLHDLRAEVLRHPDRFTPWLQIYLETHAQTIFGVLTAG